MPLLSFRRRCVMSPREQEAGAPGTPGEVLSRGRHAGPAPSPACAPGGRGQRAPVSQNRRFGAAAIAACALTAILALAWWERDALGPLPLARSFEPSTLVLDREGRLLRPYATSDGRWRLPVKLADVDPRYLEALIAYEDKRFRDHRGVDAWALGRAGLQVLRHVRIVSGGSTLTMQVARLLEPRTERSLIAKLRQMTRALQLERALSKDEILELYVNLAPFGGNLEGVRAASWAYFGQEPRGLTLAQIALLVALPQSPEARRPDRSAAAARRARDRVLARVATPAFASAEETSRARAEPVASARRPMPALAAHAADAAVAAAPEVRLHRLAIDARLQRSLEELARARAPTFGPEVSVAMIVIEHASGAVRARIGSADYHDGTRAGQVDMTRALRSPGSALKPFIYGLGFEDGVIHPDTLIEDRPLRYGSYAPENFDLTFQGTVSVRKALQLSLNVPAVAVLDAVGPSRFTARLAQAGAPLALPEGEVPGLAMSLGGVGIRLADLAMLYAGIARGGTTVPLLEQADAAQQPGRRLLDPVPAWYVGNVLLGTPPPDSAMPGRIAFKTGTSYGYRDAWALGFDGTYTIGVWVGRADGAPVPGLVGRSAAAPILFDAFARTGRKVTPLARAPRGVLPGPAAKLPLPLRQFRPGLPPVQRGEQALKITFPPNGARLERAAASRPEPMAVKVAGGIGALTVLANGIPVTQAAGQRTLFWMPDGPGFVRLTVTDSRGAADSVVVRVH